MRQVEFTRSTVAHVVVGKIIFYCRSQVRVGPASSSMGKGSMGVVPCNGLQSDP